MWCTLIVIYNGTRKLVRALISARQTCFSRRRGSREGLRELLVSGATSVETHTKWEVRGNYCDKLWRIYVCLVKSWVPLLLDGRITLRIPKYFYHTHTHSCHSVHNNNIDVNVRICIRILLGSIMRYYIRTVHYTTCTRIRKSDEKIIIPFDVWNAFEYLSNPTRRHSSRPGFIAHAQRRA